MSDLCERIRACVCAVCMRRQFVHSLVSVASARELTDNETMCAMRLASHILAASLCRSIFDSDKFVTGMCCVLQFNLIEI